MFSSSGFVSSVKEHYQAWKARQHDDPRPQRHYDQLDGTKTTLINTVQSRADQTSTTSYERTLLQDLVDKNNKLNLDPSEKSLKEAMTALTTANLWLQRDSLYRVSQMQTQSSSGF